MGTTNDPVIESTISLDQAMGITKAMKGEEIVDRWNKWKSAYPQEKNKLSPAVVAALDTLSAIVAIQTIIREIPPAVQAAVVAAGDAYNIAMSVLPGIGGAQGAKLALEKAMAALKVELTKALLKLRDIPINIYETVTNIEVDESAIL